MYQEWVEGGPLLWLHLEDQTVNSDKYSSRSDQRKQHCMKSARS